VLNIAAAEGHRAEHLPRLERLDEQRATVTDAHNLGARRGAHYARSFGAAVAEEIAHALHDAVRLPAAQREFAEAIAPLAGTALAPLLLALLAGHCRRAALPRRMNSS
jgi:hypothetical protein